MEKICYELQQLSVEYLDKEVLSIEQLQIHQFDRIGIVGKNGAGKSTLLNLLAGEIEPTRGTIHRYVNAGTFQQIEWDEQAEADATLLAKLHVPHGQQVMSGGERTRQKLAQLFSHYYEALLIDEPTTHLDQTGIHYIKEELTYYYGALVLISHDRALLDHLVTTIWEVEDGKVRVYTGNYSAYMDQKALERSQQEQAYEHYTKEKIRLEKAASEKMKMAEKVAQAGRLSKREANAKPNKANMTKSKGTSQKSMQRVAKSMEQRIERLPVIEKVKVTKPIQFRKAKALELHNKFPIMATQFCLRVERKVLLNQVSFQFPLGEKIAITGNNGVGKSMFLQQIASKAEDFTISPKVKIGYFQQKSYEFSKDETLLDFLKNRSDDNEGMLRTVLHAMQFTGTDLNKSVHVLSGGEAMRLQLCQLFLGAYNVLILDEPTNFLDIEAIQALESFMKAYEGTILFVSHDRSFIDNVADCVYEIKNQTLSKMK